MRRLDAGARTSEGLRDRKKKLTRQLISDTATEMFLRDGFDAVRVVDVAAACGVSEKTVYNYFPTKEALILDRFEDIDADVRRVFGSEGASRSPVEAPVDAIVAESVSIFGGSSLGPRIRCRRGVLSSCCNRRQRCAPRSGRCWTG